MSLEGEPGPDGGDCDADRTSFVSAHRLATIRDADLILAMAAGEMVEQATHASLLAAGGAYARLCEAQLPAPVAEVYGRVAADLALLCSL
ncbi:phosphomannomutase [Arthrobacter oryzae]|nr:hypothetical protein [Arthrobacter oryzae]MDQ0077915.1 phosphomannomutase [Arthrobacter oryzae]